MKLVTNLTMIALLLAVGVFAPAAELNWIWSHENAATKAEAGECAFRKTFNAARVGDAKLEIAADNRFELFINGRHVGSGEGWNQRKLFDVTPLLLPGRNLVAVRAMNDGADPAGLMVKLNLKPTIGATETIISDKSWKVHSKPPRGWQGPEFSDEKWDEAVELGEYGKTAPWGAAGGIVSGEAGLPATKGRNPERGLFEFKDGDRLVLLGSAFIERMQSNGYFELELQCAFPDKKLSVRNLGWSGDTVWGDARAVFGQRADGFKRLVRDVTQCDPTVILVCYGENEAYEGEAGLSDFQRGFETLLTTLEATGARIVIATPRKHENLGKPFPDQTEYNKSLRMYCDVMKDVAKQREHMFVDWFDVLTNTKDWNNRRDNPKGFITDNGIHLKTSGYYRVCERLVESLGGKRWTGNIDIDLTKGTLEVEGGLLTNLKATEQGVDFDFIAYRYCVAAMGREIRKDHGMGSGLHRWDGYHSLRVRGLKEGDYIMKFDGFIDADQIAGSDSEELAEQHDFNASELPIINSLRQLIIEKDFLFFNRHRPQNETYLFLFRKHEQGNNAVEIPQFDPLINELDKKIAELKKPVKQKFELRRVEK